VGQLTESARSWIFDFPFGSGFSDRWVRDAEDAEDYLKHVHYIEQNPVKSGLVVAGAEYSWSSAGSRFQMDGPPQRLEPPREAAVFGTAEAVP
jgi:hypothetical protein